jgi:two-component system, response regulator PdtaR
MNKPIALIVDDEPLIRMGLSDIVEGAGFHFLEAASAPEARSVLESRPDISVLITDVKMPGSFDGLDLAQCVSRARPQIKIVVVSGHADRADRRLPANARFIRKPYTAAGVIAAIS